MAVAPSTVPVQPSTGCACSIVSPGGAVTANSIIGSTRSFGASNEIDSELSLDRYAGEAMTCAAAGPAKSSALKTEMASDDHPLHLICALADLEDLLVAIEA